jgi:glycosyltransferase involved in cell wall biosynthesis
LRLLHVNDHLNWVGGIETYVLSTIPQLRERGFVQAAVYGKGDPVHVEHGICAPSVSDPNPARIENAKTELGKVFDEFRPNLAQIHNLYNVGAIEACLERVPTIVYVHDFRYVCPASSFYFRRTNVICERSCSAACFALGPVKRCLTPRIPLNIWFYRRVQWMKKNAHRFAAIIAISGYVKRRMVASGFPSEKIHVIPYFCPLKPVAAPSAVPKKPCILFMGRMAKYKGFDQFVRILARLPDSISGMMIGNVDDKLRATIGDLAKKHDCHDRLTIRGWADRDEIRGIMSQMSVVTFPSVCPETLGLVGMEALSSGVPVVGFDVGGTSEWLHHGKTGFAVPVNDLDAFAQHVLQIVESLDLRTRLAQNGINLITEKFSAEYHLNQLLSLYREATSADSRSDVQPGCEANRVASSGE